MPHYFWAEFVEIEKDVFRFDTRIYLNPIDNVKGNDIRLGSVVGKNPGSAKSIAVGNGIQPIELYGDKLLLSVRNIVKKSYKQAGVAIPDNGYIQVLNLFYLCDPDLGQATTKIKAIKHPRICQTENQEFPWVWYVWGASSETLNPYKRRFAQLNSCNHFYFDKSLSKVIKMPASETAFAKHTQGLKHEFVVPHIAGLVNNG